MKIIARVRSPFKGKFGIPRQSGIADVGAKIVFEPEFRSADAVRGMEGFSHLWVIWQFSENLREEWSPTVRPPKLGGNKRMGVFATRSPFRPNPIGLSSVRLEKIELDCGEAPVLYISGADILDGTPVYDIKPYLPYTDCHTDAYGGFAENIAEKPLRTVIPEELSEKIPPELRKGLEELLGADPRPGYQDDPDRLYTMSYGENEISFNVKGGVITVCGVEPRQ